MHKVERVAGIEPARSAWEADRLPLHHTRQSLLVSTPHRSSAIAKQRPEGHRVATHRQDHVGISPPGCDGAGRIVGVTCPVVPAPGARLGPRSRCRIVRPLCPGRLRRPLWSSALARRRRFRRSVRPRSRMVDDDRAPQGCRLGTRCRPAGDGYARRRHADPCRRPRLPLAQRCRFHRGLGDARLRPFEIAHTRSVHVLLGRTANGACHHEFRIRRRRAAGLVDRSQTSDRRRILACGAFIESWDEPIDISAHASGYQDELRAAAQRAGTDESVLTGRGLVRGRPVAVVVNEFAFLGGSIGRARGSASSPASVARPPRVCPSWPRPRRAAPGCRRGLRRSSRWSRSPAR